MTEAAILRATLLRGLRNAKRVESWGGVNDRGLGGSREYRLALVRYRALRAKNALEDFWFVREHLDTPLGSY